MENNYTYPPYPDSGESSPRSREVDFENPPPWDDPQQPPPNYKAKFMCSYGGKIQPRTHDNQLSYVGGETKILAVDLNIKFSAMISKLSALCDGADVTFKYQLPGEELDALISVTNDDDLEHMMHEYDRLFRASAKPARMRLFLFPANSSNPSSFASDQDRFIEALNSGPGQPDPVKPAPAAATGNVDYLFGLEKGVAPPPQPVAVKFHDTVPGPAVPPPMEYQVRGGSDRVIGSDPSPNPIEVQRQLQRMQIGDHDPPMYRRKSEDNSSGGYAAAGDYYVQKFADKAPPPSNLPPPQAAAPAGGYWPEKQVHGEGFPPMTASGGSGGADQPVYMIHQPGTFYHVPPQPVARPPAPATQGYYAVQRMVSDGYREQPVYSAAQRAPFSSAPQANLAPAQPVKPAAAYTDGFNVVRQGGMPDNSAGYAQVAYDSSGGRQFYYTTPAGVVHQPPYQGVVPTVGGDVRPTGVSMGQDLKVVNKVSQG